jgi:MFS family permease
MVFTHLPSAIFLALIPIPAQVHWSLVFLVLRACTQSMDTAPRAAFLAAIIPPSDRTAILGIMNIVRGWGFSIGPLITGVLADSSLFWLAFVCAGSLKAVYDLGLLAMFKNHERDREAGEVRRTEARDEEEDGEEGEAEGEAEGEGEEERGRG